MAPIFDDNLDYVQYFSKCLDRQRFLSGRVITGLPKKAAGGFILYAKTDHQEFCLFESDKQILKRRISISAIRN